MKKNGKNSLFVILIVVVPVAAVLAIATGIVLTLLQKPEKKDPPVSLPSVSQPAYVPPSSVESVPVASVAPPPPASSFPPVPSSSESIPPVPGAPVFLEPPTVMLNGSTATVTFKTDVSSTVNVILSTSGDSIGIPAFYDFFNRGGKLESAVSKTSIYKVDENGQSATFELPDLTKSYYLLVNAVENENGTWQETVLVIPLHTPAGSSSSSK